jgi:hypothetical protein
MLLFQVRLAHHSQPCSRWISPGGHYESGVHLFSIIGRGLNAVSQIRMFTESSRSDRLCIWWGWRFRVELCEYFLH